MNKRGISPLIISVLLVGFVIVIGSFVFISTSNLTKDQMDNQNFDFVIYDFGAEYSPFEEEYPCEDICAEDGDFVSCDDAEDL